jgi:EAL domain-containing protein (putative c-di-GMP-specific phosphodiesterase class I)
MDTSFLFEQRSASRFLCGINLVLGSVAGVYGVLNFGYGYPVTASVQLATAGINGVALALGMKACRTGGTSSGLPRQLTLISTLILTVILILGGGGLSLASPFLFVLPPALLLLARRPVAIALNIALIAILAASVARPGLTAWITGDDRVFNISVLVAYVAVNIYTYMIAELRFRAYRRVRYLATHDLVTGLNRFDAREACLVDSSWAVLVQLRDTDHIRLEGGNRLVEHVMRVTAQRLSERWSRDCGLFSYSETSILATPDIESFGGWSAWINTTMQDLSRPVTGEERSVTPHLAVFVVPDAETLTRSELGARLEAVIQSNRGDTSRITFYDPEIGEQIRRRIEMYDLLRSARERGELYLVYQPLVDAIDGEIVGAEVLMRWESPELGSVSPAVFIPVAEETGLISELTEWMVALAWREAQGDPEGRYLKLSINLSPAHIEQPDFVERLNGIITREGIDPSLISIEITEGLLLRESISAQSVLDTLVSLGFSLSIDDFGTGYSNLSYLRSLSVHRIKIDKSFVDDIVLPTGEVNSRATPLVEAMVFMAKTLGIGTLAEGVETEEQAAVLRDLGCETFQGYLFGRPLPLDLPSGGDGEAVGR